MLEQIEKLEKYTKNVTMEEFFQSDLLQDACITPLTQLWGISMQITHQYPRIKDIPHKELKSIRNFLVHAYQKINMDIIWTTIHEDIPELKEQILERIKKL